MAINFVTGLPRSGKTLWTLWNVKDRAIKENRQVYTCNIPDVTIPGWLTIDHPDKWMDVPDGSIIIVDELQDYWQKGSTGSKVPLPILELSKHGKRGIEFYFITQEPNLVHQTPRDLCQHHYYVVRAFGTQNALVHKYSRMQLHPEKQTKNSEKLPFKYPKEVYTWYKSADLHNVKRQVPWKVYAIPVVAIIAALAIWAAIALGKGAIDKARTSGQGKTPISTTGAQPPAPGLPGQPGASSQARQELTPQQYVESFQPRLAGLPHTAPRYDSISQAQAMPYPAACVQMGKRCQCYTSQATQLDIPADMCQQIVKRGYFMDWHHSPGSQQQGNTAPGLPAG